MQVIECYDLPESPDPDAAYRLLPKHADEAYYRERTDRNIGWITREEQKILRGSVIGIAGCGGMGGLLASLFVRAGVGEVRIADNERFDVSNINRQFAAQRGTVGSSKAFETARLTRAVSDDSTLMVYANGITEATARTFVSGCDIICDEIELLAVDGRILLHREARNSGVSLFNCNTVGFGTNLFLYTPESLTMEDALGFGYEEARRLSSLACAGNEIAHDRIMRSILRAVIPELPEYGPQDAEGRHPFLRRLAQEKKAPIIATNPPLAAGFLADRVLLYLLRDSGVARDIVPVPSMPGYLHLDAALMRATVKKEGWNPSCP
ncbi:MAG: ThiF family adenylyltransferase [Patescibacteria group bacterium]